MPTPIHCVVRSPAIANVLAAAGVDTAEQAASMTDNQILGIKGVGPAARDQIRAWQLAQKPLLPIPQDPLRAEEVRRLREDGGDPRSCLYSTRALADQLLRQAASPGRVLEERRRLLAEQLFREWATIDRERNMPPDHRAVAQEAREAAVAFYPPPVTTGEAVPEPRETP